MRSGCSSTLLRAQEVLMPYTTSEVTEFIGSITLDHEHRRNALSHALVEEVIAALRSFSESNVRVVILRAKPGAKVFSAGHDIDELPESRRDPLGWDDTLRQLVREIENFPGPVMAMVEGGVWGGATETVFACDLIVAAETATFAVTPAKLGVPYNVGPVTAKVCVLAKALRNTRFVKSTAPDPQQNQALRPSFPRASDGEVSKGTIDGRSTVQPQQRTSC